MIRIANTADATVIATIYNHYIANTCITFEEIPVKADIIAERMTDVLAQQLPWLVAEENGHIIGYAYASPYHKRSAYKYTVETSIYLHPAHTGQGVGSKLYDELLATLTQKGLHVAIGSIALPNEKSIRLHEQKGFEPAGHFKEVGFKFNQWVDVGFWQKKLSPKNV